LTLTARAVSWQEPSQVVTATADAGVPLTGCASLPFAPAVSFDLANPAADSPSGATLALNVPQGSNPDGRASVPLEGVDVALPQGVTISPSVARGLSTCPDRELGLGSAAPATCPPSSRVGAVRLSGPQLPTPLEGNLYLGEERPGERFRVFASAEGMGVAAKFAGALRVDPSTGRITAAFEQLPEVSLSQISLRFDDGPRALLATPLDCGALTTTGTFRSYVDSRVARSSATTVVARAAAGGPCPDAPPFSPLVSGGATSGGAGQSSGLTVTLRRQSGEQLLDRFRLVLPAGLSANIGSLETCAGAAAAAAACPAASRVGSAVGEVGSGASPTALNGDAYLTGPYRRAPLGLALVFDAKVGPFDLGTIVVRAALRVDPRSGRLSVESDPLPQVLEGIPIRFLTIGLDVDRPGFIRNPTSCAPTSLTAEARAVTGAVSSSSVRFALGGCDRLRFAPRLSMRLAGRSQLRPGGSPGLRIGIRSPKRSTNLRSVDIALPKSLRRNPTGVDAICARQNALDGMWPERARVGSATGKTPILSEPLTGQTYVVQPERGGQPELWTILDAEGVRFDVRSQVFARAGRLHTKLAGLPDVPLTELVMRLDGAKGGLLSLSARACTPAGRREKADVAFEGQNDAYLIDRAPVVRSRCTDSDGARMASGRGGRRHG
jgi:hypothetical protein